MTAWCTYSELLVDVGDCIANRAALMTLVLRGEVMDDVGSKCCRPYAHKDFKTNSMVPPHKHHASRTRRPYADLRHCHLALEQLHAIHQPMWCDGHWYLMIIDVPRMKLIYLDSLRDPAQAEARKTAMTRVALYLEGLTLGHSWLSGNCSVRPRFSTFDFEDPKLPKQDRKSMDCGVWVAQWMIRDHLWEDYSVHNVSNATRMRLAVDLVMKSHNEMAGDIVAKAIAHWQVKAM
ncbi:hypothetical protein AHAS_Ahas02G0201000 [Arachis hypogaea]